MKQTKWLEQMTSWLAQAFLLFLASFAIVRSTFAADIGNINASTMIQNFAESIPALMSLTTAIAYVLGMYMVIHGVILLKKFGDMRTQMSTEHSMKGPLVFIAVGAGLLYLPTSIEVGFTTFWTEPAPYAYESEDQGFSEFINACFLIVQLIGTIYFIKGMTMLTHLGGNSQQGGFSRALTHIIGGIFCIDLYDFLNMIFVTLGLGQI